MRKKIGIILLTLLTMTSGYYYYKYIINYDKTPKKLELVKNIDKKIKKENEQIKIYIPNKEHTFLEIKEVTLIKNKDIKYKIFEIFNYLKENNDLFSKEEELKKIYIEKDKLYINISNNFKSKITNAQEELMFIYSIVNTLTEIDGINKIKILVENKEIKSLRGYIDSSDFFKKDKLLIKETK
ncbi:MAG: hypothetical protein B6I28_01930 [Fusobacteriia bacterium 4572_132]|nr:MAG: hypothetical protein B6I28_01930 [Fusobacteriia bacterium 4572_132]